MIIIQQDDKQMVMTPAPAGDDIPTIFDFIELLAVLKPNHQDIEKAINDLRYALLDILGGGYYVYRKPYDRHFTKVGMTDRQMKVIEFICNETSNANLLELVSDMDGEDDS